MEHYWNKGDVEGYFTWPDFYARIAREVPQGAEIVELGTCGGMSAACLGVELVNAGKRASVHLVDTNDQTVARAALKPLAGAEGVRFVHYAHTLSWDAAAKFADGSVDVVFVDADHAYESVAKDIAAWWPKVKPGGIMAGHDFSEEFPGVVGAVIEAFEAFSVERGIRFRGPRANGAPGRYYPVWMVRK